MITIVDRTIAVASTSRLTRTLPNHILCLSLRIQCGSLPPSSIDKPIAELSGISKTSIILLQIATYLSHPKASKLTKVLLFLLSRIGMSNVIKEPMFEAISSPFGQIPPPPPWPLFHRVVTGATMA